MLDRRDLGSGVVADHGAELGLNHPVAAGRNAVVAVSDVGADEGDAGAGGGGADADTDVLSRVNANARENRRTGQRMLVKRRRRQWLSFPHTRAAPDPVTVSYPLSGVLQCGKTTPVSECNSPSALKNKALFGLRKGA